MRYPNEKLIFKIKRFIKYLPGRFAKIFLKTPFESDHTDVTVLNRNIKKPSSKLFELSLEFIENMQNINTKEFNREMLSYGQHYRLLASVVKTLSPNLVVEIGTGPGWSSISMFSNHDTKFISYDVERWQKIPKQKLTAKYLKKWDFEQRIGNLAENNFYKKEKKTISEADLIFMDGPKDGMTEYKILENFRRTKLKKGVILIVDDIRYFQMLELWNDIEYDKIDMTSFGHYTGTGIVLWGKK